MSPVPVVGDGDFHHDDTVFVTHDAQRCESRQVFKKVLRNGATGVFQGKILVKAKARRRPTATRSASRCCWTTTRNSYAKPELEIYADDVICSHGSTSGAIDEEALFYLRSRGIPDRARRRICWCWPFWPRQSTKSRIRRLPTTSLPGLTPG